MIEVEVFGSGLAPGAPPQQEIWRLCARAAARLGVEQAHVAIEFVDAGRIAQLNAEYRDHQGPTDVLSFPIDGVGAVDGVPILAGAGARTLPRELGDVVICPACTEDLREAIVHGMLHLLGLDHETDDGEMLALQGELLR